MYYCGSLSLWNTKGNREKNVRKTLQNAVHDMIEMPDDVDGLVKSNRRVW